MYNIETFNIVDKGQYKSISTIEKLNNCAFIHMDYEYRLSLQTIDHLSKTVDIYLTKDQIKSSLIDPLERILEDKSLSLTSTITNQINPAEIAYYKLTRLLYNELLIELVKFKGCNLQLNLNFKIEDDRFLVIEPSASFKSLWLKHSPKEIQPITFVLSMSEAEEFLEMLNCL